MSLQGITRILQRLTVDVASPKCISNCNRALSTVQRCQRNLNATPLRGPSQQICPTRTCPLFAAVHHRDFHRNLASPIPARIIEPWKLKEYTIRPLPMTRDGGRDPLTGRKVYNRRGGGHRRNYRMIDWVRSAPPDGPPYEEKVLAILYDPNRSTRIALVAGGTKKRYILATVNMQEGDIIKTSAKIGRMTVVANEGDAYPVGAYPIGALVHNVERTPGDGGKMVHSAGTSAQIIRKAGGQVIIQLPSKRLISVSEKCMATFGRLSNEDHHKRILGKAGRSRWLGIRPKSGWRQKKGGWAGRKIKPLPPMKVYLDPKAKGTRIEV